MTTTPMQNSRRRKDILLLMSLVGTGINATEQPRFKTLAMQAVTRTFMVLIKLHEKVDPDTQSRHRSSARVKMVVNAVLTPAFADWKPEVQLWVAAQVCQRLVASGWRPEPAEETTEFVQALYGLAQNFPVIDAPSTKVQEIVGMAPELLRTPAIGMFR